jgi:uncharacterized membrane protein YfcA
MVSVAAIGGYLVIGCISGFFAGLLGIGGGIILVPALLVAFGAAGFPQSVIFQVALGTSMATILFTALSSLRSHHRHGAVMWPVVRKFTPGVLLGTALGTYIARQVSTTGLTAFFALFLIVVAIQFGFGLRPKPGRVLPGSFGQALAGTAIGIVSSLAAVGGGAMTVPFLTWCNCPIRMAIGTAAAVGFPIAIGGTLGYIVNGWTIAELPAGSLGFVYLPALMWTVLAGMLTAPFGARAAHVLPAVVLRRVFAALLLIVAWRMLATLFD